MALLNQRLKVKRPPTNQRLMRNKKILKKNKLLKKLKRKKKRVVLLSKNTWPKRRLLTSERKPENQKKLRRQVLKRLRRIPTELRPLPAISEIKSSTALQRVKALIYLVSKVVMMNSTQEKKEEEVEAAEVAAVATEVAEAVTPTKVLDQTEVDKA